MVNSHWQVNFYLLHDILRYDKRDKSDISFTGKSFSILHQQYLKASL